ncbi:hypothetical protein [Ruania halotolerans]|uniref:hypothetical protein n=1 Tax=Ruania halotolerans TaxID=2897773 RepID=UPI001E40C6C8|nr:hypothetical protein [Ruania halotolerans]UFU06314.1 hypothetical protein LQF10_18110 [Ruania halotolerans]
MRLARGLIGVAGVLLLGVGVLTLLADVPLWQLLGLGVWLAGAIVVHDGVLVPLLQVFGLGADRVTRTLAHPARLVLRTAFGIGTVLTIVAVPAILARARGPRNASVLQVDYAQALAVAWLVIAVLGVAIAAVLTVRERRSFVRRAATADES